MKPTPAQRRVLLSLADEPARLTKVLPRWYLKNGRGNVIAGPTVQKLLGNRWVEIRTGTYGHNFREVMQHLHVTPEGLSAVEEHL